VTLLLLPRLVLPAGLLLRAHCHRHRRLPLLLLLLLRLMSYDRLLLLLRRRRRRLLLGPRRPKGTLAVWKDGQ
jgi:hypothetical protein